MKIINKHVFARFVSILKNSSDSISSSHENAINFLSNKSLFWGNSELKLVKTISAFSHKFTYLSPRQPKLKGMYVLWGRQSPESRAGPFQSCCQKHEENDFTPQKTKWGGRTRSPLVTPWEHAYVFKHSISTETFQNKSDKRCLQVYLRMREIIYRVK